MAKFNIGDRVTHITSEGPDMVVVSVFMATNAELGGIDSQAYDCEFWSAVKGEFTSNRFWETSIQASQRG